MRRPPPLTDPDDATRTLRELDGLLGLNDAILRFVEQIRDASEPFELGVALPMAGRGVTLPATQVYYNPRQRSPAFRERVVDVLRGFALDVSLARQAFAEVPVSTGSTVLGLEWRPGAEQPDATLYLEEVAQIADPDARARCRGALAALTGLPGAPPDEELGLPYIWALDLRADGGRQLKTYRRTTPAQAPEVRQGLLRHVGAAALNADSEQVLFGTDQPAGHILQDRYDSAGRRTAHKVYRCFPYEAASFDAEAANRCVAQALQGLGAGRLPLQLARLVCGGPARFGLTSLALAFGLGQPVPMYGTAYYCLERNDEARLRRP